MWATSGVPVQQQRPDGQLWYYATLVDIFEERIPPAR